MKKIFNAIIIGLGAVLCVACTAKMNYTPADITAVPGFISPTAGYFLDLQAKAGSTFTFSWMPAAAEDGYGVQYEVVFYDKPGGNKTYTLDAGLVTSVTIGHKDMNRIAATVGIEPGAIGSIYWSVDASRGEITKNAAKEARELKVKRLLGFTYVPGNFHAVGTGAEGGDAIFVPKDKIMSGAGANNAQAGDEGEFEIFTHLNKGEITFTEADGSHSWGVESGALSETPTPLAVEDGDYHISVDFNVRAFVLHKISDFAYWGGGSRKSTLTYKAKGVWETIGPIETGDDRYNFRLFEEGTGTDWVNIGPSWWNQNASTSWEETGGTDKFYLYYEPTTPTGQDGWQPTFKWLKTNMAFQRDILVDMSGYDSTGAVCQYTHSYTCL